MTYLPRVNEIAHVFSFLADAKATLLHSALTRDFVSLLLRFLIGRRPQGIYVSEPWPWCKIGTLNGFRGGQQWISLRLMKCILSVFAQVTSEPSSILFLTLLN
jgi:hypothetical protein